RQNAELVRTTRVEHRAVRLGGCLHCDPNGQNIGRGQAEISVVLVGRHSGADARRLAESLDAKSDRLAAYQAANQTYDFWFSRNVVKKGTVLFHPPEIARAFSVGLKRHLARFEVRCNV